MCCTAVSLLTRCSEACTCKVAAEVSAAQLPRHQEEEPHRIRVTTLGGREYAVDVEATDTIRRVKSMLAEMTGVRLAQQHLFSGCTELQDACQVAQCSATFVDSVVSLVVAVPKKLEILVESPASGCVSMVVSEAEPFRVLKAKIQERVPVRWEQHRLLLGGRRVNDDEALIDYAVEDCASLKIEVVTPVWVRCLPAAMLVLLLCLYALLVASFS